MFLRGPPHESVRSEQHASITGSIMDGDTVGEAAGVHPASHCDEWLLSGSAAGWAVEKSHTDSKTDFYCVFGTACSDCHIDFRLTNV